MTLWSEGTSSIKIAQGPPSTYGESVLGDQSPMGLLKYRHTPMASVVPS